MTTDDKTDSKSESNGRSESTPAATQQTTTTSTTGVTDGQVMTDNKITVINESNNDSNCAQIESTITPEECLNSGDDDLKTAVDTDIKAVETSDETPQDVHMKSAESMECLAKNTPTASSAAVDNSTNASTSSVASDTTATKASVPSKPEEVVKFKLIYMKANYDIEIGLQRTGFELKEKIQSLTSVAPAMQKLVLKGMPIKDDKTLKDNGVKNGVKVLLIGCTLDAVLAINTTTKEDIKEELTQSTTKEPLCKQKQHKKVIDRGLPDDAMPAWRNGKAELPPEPLYGMVNKYNNKVRLTFKLEADQVWIGTKERTDKLPMQNIRSIVSEPIDDHPEYHLMGIQTGPTEASRIWVYWVPSQFVDAIKDTILGK